MYSNRDQRRPAEEGLNVLVGLKLTSDTNMVADVLSLANAPSIGRLHVVTDHPYKTEIRNVVYHYLPRWIRVLPFARVLYRIPYLLRLYRKERIDFAVGYHLTSYGLATIVASRLAGIPCAAHFLGNDLDVYCRRAVMKDVVMSVASRADMLTVQGSRSAHTLKMLGQDRVEIIPTVCDVRPGESPELSERKYDMLYVGRFSVEKRPDRFIDVVRRVLEKKRDIVAVMLGSGPLDQEIRRQVADAGLADVIEIVGWTDRVDRYLSMSKIYVLPSDNDQLPLSLLEAMWAGVVPVAADVGNVCDVVDESTGFRVPADDIDLYARAVTALLDDESLRWKKASMARELVGSRFSIASNTERWERIISRAHEAGRARDGHLYRQQGTRFTI